MRGFMRLLFMFGPMILRQVQKYQRNKERQKYYDQSRPPMRQEPRRRDTEYRRGHREMPPPPPRKPEITEEERNFRLRDEDIMLDNETMQDYKGVSTASHEMDHERQDHQPQKDQARLEAPESSEPSEDDFVPSGDDKKKDKDDDGFDLKDLFFEDDEA